MTREELLEALHYDHQTGVFYWVNPTKYHPRMIGEVAGCDSTGYRLIRLNGKKYKAHRLVWFYIHGSWPDGMIDHIDGNPFNNRIENLRIASSSQNIANSKVKSGKSLPKGVRKSRGAYQARITYKGNQISLGVFSTPEEASNAYYEKAMELYGGFARK